MDAPLRVVLVGDDSVARELRDGGIEVVYLDSAAPSVVARAAIQEDADAVVTADELVADVRALLAELEAADIPALTLPQGGVDAAETVRTSVRNSR